MKLFVAALFGVLALAAADVSHLANTYLPPAQHSYSAPSYQQPAYYSGGSSGFSGFSAPSNEYLPPTQQQSYSGPSPSFASNFDQTYAAPVQAHSHNAYSAGPSSEYLPPIQHSYSAPAAHQHTYSAPAISYSQPAIHSYSGHGGSHAGGHHSGGHSGGHAISTIDAGTQYAPNGGYIYRKK